MVKCYRREVKSGDYCEFPQLEDKCVENKSKQRSVISKEQSKKIYQFFPEKKINFSVVHVCVCINGCVCVCVCMCVYVCMCMYVCVCVVVVCMSRP